MVVSVSSALSRLADRAASADGLPLLPSTVRPPAGARSARQRRLRSPPLALSTNRALRLSA